ncbi:hypothetical protein BDQ12DRAFT_232379 [Crucibulum laeve]|uniref:G-protein coupled receptors family 1 profile domain-containing protein n=1 Tax=Crucibulum laeve TaxID=68775 RepID=A0A5C3LX44_9AGAR|nr:hypothetical protein BDQ12DRAFT_232379 [Crucibulum laeve]
MDGSEVPELGYLAPVYLGLHIAGGQVGLPIIIATFLLAKNVTRHPSLINFCITWVIYSVCYCILGDVNDINSPVCFAQSALIHGAPTMSAVSTLVVVVEIWWTFREPTASRGTRWPRNTRLTLGLTLPYIAFVVFTLISGVLQNQHPDLLITNGLYCTYAGDPFRRWGVSVFCVTMLILIIIFEIAIGVRFYRLYRQIRSVFPLADRKTSPTLVIRVLIFNLYSVITLSAGILFLTDTLRAWPFMVQAALPITATIIFGTQQDLFKAWCFCRRKPNIESNTASNESIPTFRRHDSLMLTDSSTSTPSNVILMTPRDMV